MSLRGTLDLSNEEVDVRWGEIVVRGRRALRKATLIGVTTFVVAGVLVRIAELTGNFLLYYLGAMGAVVAVTLLGVRAADALRQRRGRRPSDH